MVRPGLSVTNLYVGERGSAHRGVVNFSGHMASNTFQESAMDSSCRRASTAVTQPVPEATITCEYVHAKPFHYQEPLLTPYLSSQNVNTIDIGVQTGVEPNPIQPERFHAPSVRHKLHRNPEGANPRQLPHSSDLLLRPPLLRGGATPGV